MIDILAADGRGFQACAVGCAHTNVLLQGLPTVKRLGIHLSSAAAQATLVT